MSCTSYANQFKNVALNLTYAQPSSIIYLQINEMGSFTFIENLARTSGSPFEVQFDNEGTVDIKRNWENCEF
jgi:hypothetical protein